MGEERKGDIASSLLLLRQVESSTQTRQKFTIAGVGFHPLLKATALNRLSEGETERYRYSIANLLIVLTCISSGVSMGPQTKAYLMITF